LPTPSNVDAKKINFYFFADSLLSAISIKVANNKFEYAVPIEGYPNMIQITLQTFHGAKCRLLTPQEIEKKIGVWKKYLNKNYHEILGKIELFCHQWNDNHQTLDDILNYQADSLLNIISDG
jgi:hypothetical protein